MISEIITYISDIARSHIKVDYVRYNRKININDQHNNGNFQVIIESDSTFLEKLVTVDGMLKYTINMDIISFVPNGSNVLTVQDNALLIGNEILHRMQDDERYMVEIRDYSFLGLTEFTDDDSSGVRMTLSLTVPELINLCDYDEHFIEKPEPEEEKLELSDGDDCTGTHFVKEGTLNLNPIKLK